MRLRLVRANLLVKIFQNFQTVLMPIGLTQKQAAYAVLKWLKKQGSDEELDVAVQCLSEHFQVKLDDANHALSFHILNLRQGMLLSAKTPVTSALIWKRLFGQLLPEVVMMML